MLCDICLGAFKSAGPIPLPSWSADEEADSISWVPHHASIQSLKASAETNCTICTRFLGLFADKYVNTIARAELEGTLSTHDIRLSADLSGGVLEKDIPRGTKIGAIPYFASYGQSYELRVAGYGLQSHPWDWWGKRGGQRIGINLRLESTSNTPVHNHMLEKAWLMSYQRSLNPTTDWNVARVSAPHRHYPKPNVGSKTALSTTKKLAPRTRPGVPHASLILVLWNRLAPSS